MRFNFVGDLKFSAMDSRRPYLRSGVSKNGARWQSISFGVASDVNNRAFVEMFGQDLSGKDINTKDVEGNNIEIPWEKRFDPDIIAIVANFRKRVVALDGMERKEFITDWDVIEYLKENLDTITDQRYVVTGDVQKDVFNGTIRNRFVFRNIYSAANEKKNHLEINAEIFFSYDDIDLADWKTEQKIGVNAYTNEYISKDDAGVYVANSFIFDCSKVDFSKEDHRAKAKVRAKQIGVELDDKGNAKIVLKKNKVYQNSVVIAYVNGAEELEWSYDMLTAEQKEFVDAGLHDVDFYRPRGQIRGERVVLYKIRDFELQGKYTSGLIFCEDSMKEFAEKVYAPIIPDETAEEALKGGMNPPEEDDSSEDTEIEDLFV